MRGSREDMSGDRRGRWRIIGAVAAVAVAGAGLGACTDDGAETVEASPSVLADTAADIRSGRMEVSIGPLRQVVEFDGEDGRATMEISDEAAAALAGQSDSPEDRESVTSFTEPSMESLQVDGVRYVSRGGRWVKMPDPAHDSGPAAEDSEVVESFETVPPDEQPASADTLAALVGALAKTSVDEPGEPAERDGQAVVRYRTELTAGEATDLITEIGGDTWVASATSEDRYERVRAYEQEHTTVELVGEVGERGDLVRLEVHQRADTSSYPDCRPYSAELFGSFANISAVLTEINEPQDIQAPPAELIDEFEVPSLGDLGIPGGEVPPEIQAELDAAIGGPQFDVEADAAAESLQTATGPRTRSEILDYLRRWAEGAGIDWRTIPLPDDAGMVALFDARYADDVTGRGPELVTTLGPYPRGYLVEVVRELDPSVDAASLDDAALVAAYEGLRGVGDVPSTSDRADDMTTDSTVVSSDDVDDDSEGSYFDGESEDEYLEGCPD